jgi:hypothetical protein
MNDPAIIFPALIILVVAVLLAAMVSEGCYGRWKRRAADPPGAG